MTAVKRRLSTILAALSLLLFVAVVVLWVRSHIAGDYWGYGAYDGRLYGVSSGKGFVSIDRSELNPLNVRKGADWRLGLPPYYPVSGPARSVPERLGFWWITGRTSSGPFVRVIVPCWFVAGVTLLVPCLWLLRWWRDVPLRRKRLGLCPSWGTSRPALA